MQIDKRDEIGCAQLEGKIGIKRNELTRFGSTGATTGRIAFRRFKKRAKLKTTP
jgi:hypothetical protein